MENSHENAPETNEIAPETNETAAESASEGLKPSMIGSKDGDTAADNDQPYIFGRRPNARAPYPFTERQYARLLILRGRRDADDLSERRAA
jgi:hypothetical protein